MTTLEPDAVIVTDTDSKEIGAKVSLSPNTKLVEDHDKNSSRVSAQTREVTQLFRRKHGFQPPFHCLQVLTWILYAFR